MASRNKRYHRRITAPDTRPMDDGMWMWEWFGWTEPPLWDEDPEEMEYRQAALSEDDRVIEQIGVDYSDWREYGFRDAGMVHEDEYMHDRMIEYDLENYHDLTWMK